MDQLLTGLRATIEMKKPFPFSAFHFFSFSALHLVRSKFKNTHAEVCNTCPG